MKRVFVLKRDWFDQRRKEIEGLERDLLDLKLVEADKRAAELMNAALQESEGTRLAGYELDWLVQQALDSAPEIVRLLAQCHLSGEEADRLESWLDTLSNEEVPEDLTPSILHLRDALSAEEAQEVLILEEEPGFEFHFSRQAEDSGTV